MEGFNEIYNERFKKTEKKNDKTDRDNFKYKKKLKTDFSAFSDLIVFLIE